VTVSTPLSVLIVEDNEDDAQLILRELRRGGFAPSWVRVETAAAMADALAQADWQVVISDYSLPGFSAPLALQLMQDRGLDLPFLIVSGTIGEETAVAALKAGAHDFLLKDGLSRLVPAVERELREAASRREKRAALEALAASEHRYRELVESINDVIFTLDPGGVITYISPVIERLTGFRPDELVGLDFRSFVDPADRDAVAEEFAKTLRGIGVRLEARLIARDGSRKWVATSGRPAAAGEPFPVIRGLLYDISARKQAQEQLLQAQKLEAVGQLAAGVAHDFNNLLQAMIGYVEVLRSEGALPPEATQIVAELAVLIRRASALPRQLLLFSRRSVTTVEHLDLNAVVREACVFLRRLVQANVSFTVAPDGGSLFVHADQAQLEQVLLNLIVNGVDAMPEGGRLEVRTGSSGAEHWFEVADTGDGISPEVRDRIFEPFFTTKGAGKGTGLGLSVVQGIVAEHGGRVDVESTVGRGTRLRVVLPASAAPVEPPTGRGAGRVGGAPAAPATVLLAEDDPAVRRLFAAALRRLGYNVTEIGRADEAASLPVEPVFDLAVSDFMLPDASGLELVRGLKRRWPGMRVIFVSGYAVDEIVRHEDLGFPARFLQKPVDIETLAREVAEALAEP